jgi:hypothetical protein
MPANTSPIFPLTPNVGWAKGALTANTTTDLTGGTSYLVFTAGANGAWLDEIIFRPLGTNVLTVGRVWDNNGSTTGTAANNCQIDEITLPATTVTQTAAQPPMRLPIKRALPAGHRIYITLGTGVAAGFDISAHGGDY